VVGGLGGMGGGGGVEGDECRLLGAVRHALQFREPVHAETAHLNATPHPTRFVWDSNTSTMHAPVIDHPLDLYRWASSFYIVVIP